MRTLRKQNNATKKRKKKEIQRLTQKKIKHIQTQKKNKRTNKQNATLTAGIEPATTHCMCCSTIELSEFFFQLLAFCICVKTHASSKKKHKAKK